MASADKFAGFPEETLLFLRGLSENNDRVWFNAHEREYEAYYLQPSLALDDALGPRLAAKVSNETRFEARVGGSLMRIYRDTRFS